MASDYLTPTEQDVEEQRRKVEEQNRMSALAQRLRVGNVTSPGIASIEPLGAPVPVGPVVGPLTNEQKLASRTQVPVAAPVASPIPTQAAPQAAPVSSRLNVAANRLRQAYSKQGEAIEAQADLASTQAKVEKDRLTLESDLATQKAQREIIENESYLKDKEALMQEQAKEQVARQTAVDESLSRLQENQDAAKEAKIEPWSEQSFGNKITLAIGAALIGYAGGLQGDPGAGMRVVESAINRDIARQKANLANKRATIKDAQTAVGMAKQAYEDGNTQDLAAQKILWNNVQEKLNTMALKAMPQEQANRLAQQKAAVDAKVLETEGKLKLSIAENEVSGAGVLADVAAKQDSAALQRAQLRQAAMLKQIELAQKNKTKLRPVSEQTAKQIGELNGAEELIDALEEDFDENTSPVSFLAKHIPGTPSSDYESTRDAFVQHMARGIYGATPPVAEINAIKKLIPDASEWGVKTPAMFEGLRALARDKKVNMLHALSTGGFDVSRYMRQEDVSSFQ